LSFTNLILKDFYFRDDTIDAHPGKLFGVYFVVISFYLFDGLRNLIAKYQRSKGEERLQILYPLLGLSFSAGIIFFLNLVLGVFLPLPPEVLRGGNYSLLIFFVLTAFAITRYHLFGIEVILTEILVGAIGILLLIQVFAAPTFSWKLFNGGIFILFCIGGWLLIRYTFREIRRREESERISRAKTEFISIASHQLRTPLTAIKGYLSMALEGDYGEVPEKLKVPLKNVYLSNERLIKLVEDLLRVSKIEAGKMEMKFEKTNLENLIGEVISMMEVEAKQKGLYLKFERPKEKLPEILIDREKIRQVILNLIDNAIKYTKEGGVTVGLKRVKNFLQIFVVDTGEGMSKEEISKIFESFSRGSAGQKLWTEGAGLGLYIAKKLVELHKGKIWAESQGKGKGSTFFVELPIK